MTRSMTAFARRESAGPWGSLTIELRSVNHRYLEVSPRLPEELRVLEPRLREQVAAVLSRGKVDLTLRYQPPDPTAGLDIDRELVKRIAHLSREVDQILYDPAPVQALELLHWPGVLRTPVVDAEQLHGAALALLDAALAELTEHRGREGEKLAEIIRQRCDGASALVAAVRVRRPEVVERVRERYRQRLAELRIDADPGRLEQELALAAQRLDVDEELDRLDTHLEEVSRVLRQNQPVGRRLDFLMQELNREANTLGSKSADAETTRASVDLKVLIEQMREQVQNIE